MAELSNEQLAGAFASAVKSGRTQAAKDLEKEIKRRQNDTLPNAVGDILSKRKQAVTDIYSEPYDPLDPTTDMPSRNIRAIGGQVIGGAGEIVGEAVERSGVLEQSAFKTVDQFMNYLGTTALCQELSRAYDRGNEYLQEWSNRDPQNKRILETAEGFLNIGVQGVGKSAIPRVSGKKTEEAGEFFIKRGAEQATKNRKADLTEFFSPEMNKREVDDIVQTGTILKRRVWNPRDPLTQRALEYATNKLPKLKTKDPFKARDVLESNLTAVENKLITGLRSSKVTLDPAEVIRELDAKLAEQFGTKQWKDKPEARAAAELFDVSVDRLQKGDGSLESLLLLRRELDSIFGSKRLYTNDQAFIGKESIKTIRTKMNEILDREAIDVDVKDLLSEQSYSLRLKDHLEPKIMASTNSFLDTLGRKISPYVSTTGPGLYATASVFSGAGAAAAASGPTLIGAGLGAGSGLTLFGIGYATTTPTAKKVLGNMLKATGVAIKAAEKTGAADVVASLKADRLLLVDIIQNTTEGTEVVFEDEE